MIIPLPPNLSLPEKPAQQLAMGQLFGASLSWALYAIAKTAKQWLMVVTKDITAAHQLERELRFYHSDSDAWPILFFPDWETLPFDHFSPHPDIISERMAVLSQIGQLKQGILLVAANTLMHYLPPREYLNNNSLLLKRGQLLHPQSFKEQLEKSGYRHVTQVMEHGEYAIRGSIIDIFPMGSDSPYRIDLFDQEIDSLRTFDPDTQRTAQVIDKIDLLPAHEFPLTDDSIALFRSAWRDRFHGNPMDSSMYQNISRRESAPGIEYYLPLFFTHTATLFDYLPSYSLVAAVEDIHAASTHFWQEINERYEQLSHDIKRPILSPADIFIPVDQLFSRINAFPKLQLQLGSLAIAKSWQLNLAVTPIPDVSIHYSAAQPLQKLENWLLHYSGRVLFVTESAGRKEVLEELLRERNIRCIFYTDWSQFLNDTQPLGMMIAPFEHGFILEHPALAVVTEQELFGEQVRQSRLRKRSTMEAQTIIRELTELKLGDPLVHIDHGVGRYLGLQIIQTSGLEAEYLTLEYENQAKLYVPIASLHLLSRYSGTDKDKAPLHRLGSGQWEKIRRKAAEKIRDVAAELLNIYAQRAAKQGFTFAKPDQHYLAFSAAFPFELTIDQELAVNKVIEDMNVSRCMDRLICGDVGFGKTEVAMRAAFLAVQSDKQVAVLVPTTLLAEQHLHNFQDRFAKWPVRIEAISRFRSAKEQTKILEELKQGKIDIIIGTHKLLQPTVLFKSLGLLIVDEEHRFGVRQKERIKALRAEVDLLTLTATPIPRTLNMAMAAIRDLSIIATPPARRLSVKTFVREYDKPLIREAILREILRGGQVYFLHNEVHSIERMKEELLTLLPEVRIAIAHGQMREQALERVMVDFYHQRFNVLLCTTIIESGIDIPTANTMIINRADRFGLAQLHQLRGRVGRSHHQAYAYLLTPPEDVLTADAKKRLTAIESLEELGSGFILATHDLEIRGAGELLGEEQSGHIEAIGFSLYMELLDETVKALQAGKTLSLDKPLQAVTEVDLKIPALIPEDYLPDVHMRLVLYQRIANAKTSDDLEELQVEMIDRFGILPQQAKNLFQTAELKLLASSLSVRKIDVGKELGTIEFMPNPSINLTALIQLIQKQPDRYKLLNNEKLKFAVPEDTPATKIKLVKDLLGKLHGTAN